MQKGRAETQMSEAHFKRCLYARGYLLTSYPCALPKRDWIQVQVGSLYLSYDPVNPFSLARVSLGQRVRGFPDCWTAILGCVLDTQTRSIENRTLANQALLALMSSEDALFDLVDHWAGRFLLIYFSRGQTRVMTDACGTRSAYYSFKRGLTVASHARITAEQIAAGLCPIMSECSKDPRWLGSVGRFPGNATPFADVWVLTPNTLISVEKTVIRRFFPRKELKPLSAGEAAEIAAPILRRTALTWAKQYPIVASLTAGIDSRTKLAALREARESIGFFTHVAAGRKLEEKDFAVAANIATALGLNFTKLELADGHGHLWEQFCAAHAANVYTEHRRDAAWAYLNHFAPGAVNLRSQLSGIAKAFYHKQHKNPHPVTAQGMANTFKPKPMGDNRLVVELFERFRLTTQFDGIANYDPCSLLHWEQRMSSWHTSLLLETDPACDTLDIFNNRMVLSPLLAVPLKEQKRELALYNIIERLWPELLRWDVNGKRVPIQA